MRFLLSIMAIAMFAVSVGCDKPAEKPAVSKAPAASPTAPAVSATANTEGTQKVSLKLPGMT